MSHVSPKKLRESKGVNIAEIELCYVVETSVRIYPLMQVAPRALNLQTPKYQCCYHIDKATAFAADLWDPRVGCLDARMLG